MKTMSKALKGIIYATGAAAAVYILYIVVSAALSPTRITVDHIISSDPLWECKQILQDQFVQQKAAQNSTAMQNIVRQLQAHNPDNCHRTPLEPNHRQHHRHPLVLAQQPSHQAHPSRRRSPSPSGHQHLHALQNSHNTLFRTIRRRHRPPFHRKRRPQQHNHLLVQPRGTTTLRPGQMLVVLRKNPRMGHPLVNNPNLPQDTPIT